MNSLLFRSRAAVLWVALTVALMGSWLLILFEAGRLEELLAGTIEGEPLDDTVRFTFVALVMLPLVMAGVTLLLSDRVNCWLNVVAGSALGLFGVYGVGSELLIGGRSRPRRPRGAPTAEGRARDGSLSRDVEISQQCCR